MQITLRDFIKNLEQGVNQTKVEQSLAIAKGSIPDMNAYNRACGRIQGMEAVVQMAKGMMEQLREMDDKEGDLPEMKQ
jgi:hypothetical protein